MSVLVFSPYGLASEETGVLALLANFLRQSNYAISALNCNGAFSLCDRDGENAWRRGVRSCFSCLHEQRSVARWAGLPTHEISTFISPEEVNATKRWSLGITHQNFERILFEGQPMFPLVRHSFFARFGVGHPEVTSEEQLETLRRLMISSARMYLGSRRFFAAHETHLVLVAGGVDYLSASFARAARDAGVGVAQFRWDMLTRSVQVSHPAAEAPYSCPLVFEDVTSMRADSRTWPGEIVRIIDELMVFLGVTTGSMELPIAQ
jgi:hypothetical protein